LDGPQTAGQNKLHAIINTYAHGTVRQILAQNWVEWKQALSSQLFAIYAVALFLLGMWVWRAGILQRFDEYRPVFKRVCAWCIPVGLIINLYVASMMLIVPPGVVSVWAWSAGVLWLPGAHILSAGYATGLALIFMNKDKRRFLLPFAAVGRMALTDYLMQSVICTLFFYHYTTGLYGRVGPAIGLVLTFILYGVQVVFSNWWLQRYRFGPMEWLWRGMTYGKFPSMYKDEPMPTIEVPALEAPALLSPSIALSAADRAQTVAAHDKIIE
jgi:uncharacterized protein